MKKIYFLVALLFATTWATTALAQNPSTAPTRSSKAVYFDISKPLSSLPAGAIHTAKLRKEVQDGLSTGRSAGDIYSGIGDRDAVRQTEMGTIVPNRGTGIIWEGQSTNSYPTDCNGAAGRNGQYMQTINSTYQIYDKEGNTLVNKTAMNTLFEGVTGAQNNDGDPLILYDENADRWLAVEFSVSDAPENYMLIAVSTTNDATGTWYRYSFEMYNSAGYIPDYEKIGIWRDGYYMGTNTYSQSDIYVFEREAMIAGNPNAQMVEWDNPYRPGGFHVTQPIDNDGPFAPEGTPGMFMDLYRTSNTNTNKVRLYNCSVDWENTNNSTFIKSQDLVVAQCNTTALGDASIHQLGSTQLLDAISQILMYRVQYRNFGDHQTIVASHAVDVDATSGTQAGVRWYELRKETAASTWGIRQQSTYAPDQHERWMSSIAMNANHEIALGYTVSSSTMYPSIKYCGQSAAANAAGNGVMDIAEATIYDGEQSQPSSSFDGSNRWGDYSLMCTDPENDHTFWFTSEYFLNGKRTKIASLQLSAPNFPENLEANATGPTQIAISYTPNPGSTTLIAWSDTPNFGNPVDGTAYSAGTLLAGGGTVVSYSSSSSVMHSALDANTTYYYKAWSHNGNTTYSIGVSGQATTSCSAVEVMPWNEPIDDFQFSNCLTHEYIVSTTDWIIETGNGAGSPAGAHSGTVNALLKNSSTSDHKSLLVMPVYDFTAKVGANITFWHAQYRQFSFQDELRVMYKTTASGNWTEAAAFTTEVAGWTEVTVQLPEAAGKADYWVAFEGNAKGGKGVVVDDIQVFEAEFISVNDISANQTQVFPNPSNNGVFTITTASDMVGSEVIITDISGKEVYNKNLKNTTEKFDLSNQPKGVYILSLKKGEKLYTSRLVIK